MPQGAGTPIDQIVLSLDDGLNSMVQQIMQKALEVCDGNVTLAATMLGVNRKTIYNRLGSASRGKQATAPITDDRGGQDVPSTAPLDAVS